VTTSMCLVGALLWLALGCCSLGVMTRRATMEFCLLNAAVLLS
jgi:hypothetical protein